VQRNKQDRNLNNKKELLNEAKTGYNKNNKVQKGQAGSTIGKYTQDDGKKDNKGRCRE